MVGGFAVAAHGVVRATVDVDVVPAPGPANDHRLAEAPITRTKARRRTATARPPLGSGSRKTSGPAAIVMTLAAALVRAITATAPPAWSEPAETSRPTSESARMTSASGWSRTPR